MHETSSGSIPSIELTGRSVPGALDRHEGIPGWNQARYSSSSVLLVGAGGLAAFIAPLLVRKGIGAITILDDDIVEASNLNRQRFYAKDIGENKAVALARNLLPECTRATKLAGLGARFEQAVEIGVDFDFDVALCAVDNDPARVVMSRYFRACRKPVIFTGVSAQGDHGYVFVQEPSEACFNCLFPDAWEGGFPCPGTPVISDILAAVGALASFATDSVLVGRAREWNYRRLELKSGSMDAGVRIGCHPECNHREIR